MAPMYIIALPGTLGTLTEICCAWNNSTLCPLRGVDKPTIVAWKDPWEKVLVPLAVSLNFPANQIESIIFVENVTSAINALISRVEKEQCQLLCPQA